MTQKHTRPADEPRRGGARQGVAEPEPRPLVGAATQLRDRVDDLSKRVRGLESMEKRIAELERELQEARERAEATRAPPSTAKKPEPKARHAHAKGARHDLERRRCRPDLLAFELDRKRLGASTSTRRARRTSTFGWWTCLPL